MGAFHLDIDLYFWMIDRGDIEDDQRNKVEMEQQRVRLHRDHSQRIENAFYVGKIMHVIRRTIIKKSKKPFTLDPNLHSMKDQQSTSTKEYNWNLVVQELKKFNIRPTKEQKAHLIGGKHSLMHDILQQLYEYDQNLLAYNGNPAGLNQSRSPDVRLNDNHSEMNFINDNPLQGGNQGRFIKDSDSQVHRSIPVDSSNHKFAPARARNSAAILAGAPTRKPALDPISYTDSREIMRQSPTSLDELQRGNAVLNQEFGYHQDADMSDLIGYPGGNSQQYLSKRLENHPIRNAGEPLSAREDNIVAAYPDQAYQGNRIGLSDCSSTLDFILEGLSQSLGMTQSQAAALLANNSKYLMHLCVKGMKGQDFSRLTNWYKLIIQFTARLVDLLEFEMNDPQALSMTLNVIKAGLFSTNSEVANLCCRVLNKLSSIIHDRVKNPQSNAPQLQIMLWEWLTTSQNITPAQIPQPVKGGKSGKVTKSQLELESYVGEAGLLGFIRSYRIHEHEIIEVFTASMVQFGRDNFVELFTFQLKNFSEDEMDYLRIIQDIVPILVSTQKGRVAFIDSGVMHMIIDMCLQIGENQHSINDNRQIALALLVQFWKSKPEVIQAQENEGRMTDAIIRALRGACRDTRSKAVSLTAINLSFYLLGGFAGERNMFAPILYKALVFVLIDCYLNLELREELLKNFIQLFRDHQNIPIGILCDPFLKQVIINLEKQDVIQSLNHQTILQPAGEHFTLNTTDFELFLAIAVHPKLTAGIAVQLLKIVSQIARKNIIFTRASLKLLLTILAKFENNTQVFAYSQKLVTELIEVIYSQDEVKIEIYNSLKDNPRGKAKRKVVADRSFNPGLNTGTQNARYQARDSKSPSDKLDDSHIQAVISPTNNIDESARYMSIRTSEKLIVNLLQCLIQTGIKVLADFSRQQLLESLLKTEKKLKFRNRGLIYLLSFFEKDVGKLLQFTKQQTALEKTMKAKQRKLEKEKAQFANLNQSVDYGPRKLEYDDLNGRNMLDSLDELPKPGARNPRGNALIVPSAQKRKYGPGPYVENTLPAYAGKDDDSLLRDSHQTRYNLDDYQLYDRPPALDDGRGYKHAPQTLKHGRGKSSGVNDAIRSITRKEPPRMAGLARRPTQGQLKLLDISDESATEQQRYLFWVKDWLKLYRAMFAKYAGASSVAKNKAAGTFDNLQDQRKTMTLAQIFAFLSDFKVSKIEARREDVQRIIKLINLKDQSNINPVSDLDLEGFIEFVLQLGYFLYKDTAPRASKFLPMLFERLREVSVASKTPLFQRLLEDPHAAPVGDAIYINRLTEIVNDDPDYQLPPGYVKVRADKLREIEGLDPNRFPYQSDQISVQVIGDLFEEIFDIPLLEPRIEVEENWIVKPSQGFKKPKQARYMEVGDRHRFKTLLQQEEDKKRALLDEQARTKEISLDPYEALPRARVGYGPGGKKRRGHGTVNSSSALERIAPQDNRYGVRSPIVERNRVLDPYDDRFASSKRKDYGSLKQRDQNISVGLKIELAKRQAQNPDYADNLRESAYLLDDMTMAVQKGRHKLSPRDQSPPRALNRLMERKLEKQQRDLSEKIMKEDKKARRQQTLKLKLENYKEQKKINELHKYQGAIDEREKIRQAQELKAKKKEKYYESLKKDYEQERLPQIEENKKLEVELKNWTKQDNERKKKLAQQKIDEQTAKLRQDFAQTAINRDLQEEKAAEEDRLRQLEAGDRRDRVANGALRSQKTNLSPRNNQRSQSVRKTSKSRKDDGNKLLKEDRLKKAQTLQSSEKKALQRGSTSAKKLNGAGSKGRLAPIKEAPARR